MNNFKNRTMLSALTKDRKSTLVLSKSDSVSEALLEVSSCWQLGGTAAYGADPAPPLIMDNLGNFLNPSGSQHLLLEKGVVQEHTFGFCSCQSWVYTPWPLRQGESVYRDSSRFSVIVIVTLNNCHTEKATLHKAMKHFSFFSIHEALSSTYMFITLNCEVWEMTTIISAS